ncbi:DUF1850 domain-containing protein [Virgibacillus sp. W0430]|uniref:DUF1850 domain-containing protein n=1 Tax=Virgibacillus sp. W0430 TaxID=3391580 RepID=UPI003F462842
MRTYKIFNKKTIFVFSSILLVLGIVIVFIIPTKTTLIFYKQHSSEIAAHLPIKPGDTFDIIFTHSIHLTDVEERYMIQNDYSIKQYEIIYEHFGIGMPSNANAGETFVYEDGKYHIQNINTVFPAMKIRNGKTVSKHRLVWDHAKKEKKVFFNDYFEPGAWFTVKVEKISLWKFWKGVTIRE